MSNERFCRAHNSSQCTNLNGNCDFVPAPPSIPEDDGKLIERLRAREKTPSGVGYGGFALRNPDGPEAAICIETLSREIEWLRSVKFCLECGRPLDMNKDGSGSCEQCRMFFSFEELNASLVTIEKRVRAKTLEEAAKAAEDLSAHIVAEQIRDMIATGPAAGQTSQ